MNAERPSRLRFESSERDTLMPSVDLGQLITGLVERVLRRWTTIAVFLFAAVVLSIAYVMSATPKYTANGSILIDPRIGSTPNGGETMIPGLLMSDALTVDSELRVLVSREVTTRVVKKLQLENTPPEESSALRQVAEAFGLVSGAEVNEGLSDTSLQERRIEALRRSLVEGLRVERAGDSFVLDISYTAANLEFAPLVVNTLMREYIALSGEEQIARAEQVREWLAGRIDDLRRDVQQAETAVAKYRQDNQLLAPQGALLPTEVALNSAISNLVQLRGQAVSVDVQIEQLSQQIANGELDTIQIPDEERTPALAEFESRYTVLRQAEQELLLSWDEGAPLVVANRQQQDQTRALIIGEYSQILDRLRARGDTLNRQVDATQRVIGELQDQYAQETTKTVELRSLEREAEAKRVLYEQLLEEYNSTSQLATFAGTSGRVIAWAVAPDRKSAPQSKRVLLLAVFGALVLSMGVIFLQEALDRGFRVQSDLSRSTGLPFIGVVPAFRSDRTLVSGLAAPQRSERWKKLSKTAQRYDFAASWPASVYAETMRAVHVRLALERDQSQPAGMAVGIMSSVRGEGKTTTAANLATYLAKQGERVALVDLDVISRDLSRQVSGVLPKTNELSAFVQDPVLAMERLSVIPEFPKLALIGNTDTSEARPSATRDAERLQAALEQLRVHFDYVIVDLPPLQGAADTQLLSRMCDRVVYVIRWGDTPKEQVAAAVRKLGSMKDRLIGFVFSQANLKEYRSYNPQDVTDYYS